MTDYLASPDPLQRTAARARAWLMQEAFPLWSTAGHAEAGDFVEGLTMAGSPETDTPRRTLVQARQVYAYSEAERLGWPGGAKIARVGLERLLDRNPAPDGGWVHALHADGVTADGRRQLYDHAFVLFALGQAATLLDEPRTRVAAEETLTFLDAALAEATGGYAEGLPPTLPRRSNPHMHLLEALLVWVEIDEAAFAPRAQTLLDLFGRAFFDAEAGVLTEYFTPDWRPAAGVAGRVVEPGHLYEWAWLLGWARHLGLRTPDGAADALFAFAERHGRDAAGFVIDECDRDGAQVRLTRRLWPQTERIKALVARARQGDAEAYTAAATHAEAVLDTYLAGPVSGGWIDRFDAEARPDVERIPASSLYHVTLAFAELIGLAEDRARLASKRPGG